MNNSRLNIIEATFINNIIFKKCVKTSEEIFK